MEYFPLRTVVESLKQVTTPVGGPAVYGFRQFHPFGSSYPPFAETWVQLSKFALGVAGLVWAFNRVKEKNKMRVKSVFIIIVFYDDYFIPILRYKIYQYLAESGIEFALWADKVSLVS